jgi:hypothetical protein
VQYRVLVFFDDYTEFPSALVQLTNKLQGKEQQTAKPQRRWLLASSALPSRGMYRVREFMRCGYGKFPEILFLFSHGTDVRIKA